MRDKNNMVNSIENFPKGETRENYEELKDEERSGYKDRLQEEAVKMNEMKNTDGFKDALEKEVPEAAESFLNNIKDNREKFPQYDARAIGHREREVIKEFKNQKNWFAAKRAIENSLIPEDPNDSSVQETALTNKQNRMKQLEKESGMKYDDIKE